MKLASDGQTIEVFGLTSKGEKQATEGNGVFDFPTEVDGKTKFDFRATVGFSYFGWKRYEKITGIIFDVNFKVENLYIQPSGRNGGFIPVWLIFEGKQEHFLNSDVYTRNGIIFRQNLKSDFEIPVDWGDASSGLIDKDSMLTFQEEINDDGIIVKDSIYYGQIFDNFTDNNVIIVPDSATSVAGTGATNNTSLHSQRNVLIYGRYIPTLEIVRIPSSILRIQQDNVLGDKADYGYRPGLKTVYVYSSTIVDKRAFSQDVEIVILENK
jgi:hypothetical protein